MKGKTPCLIVAGLYLALAHQVLAAPAGKGAFAPAKVSGKADVGDAKPVERFMLPEISVSDLTLEEALGRLKAAYDETCKQTRESPLTISFVVPESGHKLSQIKLAGDFHRSVLMLSSLCGMRAELHGTEYRLSALTGEEKITKTLQVPPDFGSSVQQFAMTAKREPIGRLLADIGLVSDPEAVISLKGDGRLILTNVRSADVQAISDFCLAFSPLPKQFKFTLTVIELPKEAGVTVPAADLTEDQALDFKKKVSRKAGVDLSALPSVAGRIGEGTTIEIVNDFPAAKDLKAGEKSVVVGRVARLKANLVGRKFDVKLDYSDTNGSISPTTQKAVVGQHAKFEEREFFSDGESKVFAQTRADGSKTLLLVQADLIDATGRLVRESR